MDQSKLVLAIHDLVNSHTANNHEAMKTEFSLIIFRILRSKNPEVTDQKIIDDAVEAFRAVLTESFETYREVAPILDLLREIGNGK